MNIRRLHARHRARGSIAVEFAFLMPVILAFLAGLLFLGRLLWYYTVAEKAAHDAARFLATAGASEMRAYAAGGPTAVAQLAREIAQTELADLPMGEAGAAGVTVYCFGIGWDTCYGTSVPTKVLVRITVPMTDPFLDAFTGNLSGGGMFFFTTQAMTDYAGN